jgi:two-component system sensor histidine kinase/response regulator
MTILDYILIVLLATCAAYGIILTISYRRNFHKIIFLKKELEKKEALFKAVTSGCLDGFCMLEAVKDSNGNVSDFTFKEINQLAAKQKDLPRRDIIGRSVCEVNPLFKEKGFIDLFKEVYRTGKPFEQEYTMPSKTFESSWYYQQIIPYYDGVIIYNRDITKRKLEAENEKHLTEKLTEANISKDRIISILAHDLRSPLSGIIGLTNIMSDEYEELSDNEIKDYLNTTAKTATDIFSLLDNLLEWARIKTGKKEVEPIVFDLKSQITNVLELLQLNALTKNIEIKNEVPVKTLVNADKNCVNSILRNLISNAIKFTRDKGKITITSTQKGNKIVVAINDTGMGIDKDKLKRLFNFDVVSSQGTNFEKGSGFGLLICKDLIEKNNGEI